MLGYEDAGQISITDQNLTVDSGTLSVSNANLLDATTEGTVTADIATDSTVDNLTTLTGTGNAYTIVIGSGDATGSTAAEFNTINAATSVAIDATAVTGIAPDTASNIKTLLTAGNDTSQFTETSFANLTSVSVFNATEYLESNADLKEFFGSDLEAATTHYVNNGRSEGRTDGTKDVSDLNAIIASANTATGGTSTVLELSLSSTINSGNETEFNTLLTHEANGQINITSQNLTVDSGTISASTANQLAATTIGTVTAEIDTTATINGLKTLTGTNAYTIVIN